MESWFQDWFKALETVVADVEQVILDTAKEMAEAVDALADLSDEIMTQFEQAIAPDDTWDEQFDEWFDSVLDTFFGYESALSDAIEPVTHTVEPMLNQHPTCVGCRHYHGQVYGGNLLVCGMHPYGCDLEQCPDWESTWSD